jgi:hypothetical protein
MAQNVPLILTALGTTGQTVGALRSGRADSAALQAQARVAQDQGFRDEEAQRRANRYKLGDQAASFAELGGGQDEGVMRQSAINAELDALNIRYAAAIHASGLNAQAANAKRQSRLLAGSALLSGAGQAYGQAQASGLLVKKPPKPPKAPSPSPWP